MKNLTSTLLAIFLFTLATHWLSAQSNEDQLYIVQSTQVLPSKMMDYEKRMKRTIGAMKTAGVNDITWYANRAGFTYMYAVAIDNMAAMDQNFWASAIEKVGAEKFADLTGAFQECISEEKQEIYLRKADLSYQHKSQKGQTQNFRVWTAYQFKNGTQKEVAAIAKNYKDLFTEHNVEATYSLYYGVMGTNANTVVVVQSAKDAVAFAQQEAKNNKILGDKSQPIVQRLYTILDKYDTTRGGFLPHLSYMPQVTSIVAEKED